VESQAFISGNVAIHQYTKIGRLAMIAGGTRVNKDVPPYFLYAGLYVQPKGLNLVGLRRAGFGDEEIRALKAAYRLLYKSGLKLEDALQRIDAELPNEPTRHLTCFIRSSQRGICRS
jgi:UDP-N-acetylglucosamine acyltransferase